MGTAIKCNLNVVQQEQCEESEGTIRTEPCLYKALRPSFWPGPIVIEVERLRELDAR